MPQATVNTTTTTATSSQIVAKVLSPAVRLWLRSQVSQVSHLEFKIFGSDRQILSGYIPKVLISASQAVYQGLHVSQIHLVAENIRINVGGVLKGKPLRLLEPVPVVGEMLLQESDLNASLQSKLLSTALADLCLTLLSERSPQAGQKMNWHKITLDRCQIILDGTLTQEVNSTPVTIRTGLKLASRQELTLEATEIRTCTGELLAHRNHLQFDLGPEVDIQELTLMPGKLHCRGSVNVLP
jgi:hypothetical protein